MWAGLAASDASKSDSLAMWVQSSELVAMAARCALVALQHGARPANGQKCPLRSDHGAVLHPQGNGRGATSLHPVAGEPSSKLTSRTLRFRTRIAEHMFIPRFDRVCRRGPRAAARCACVVPPFNALLALGVVLVLHPQIVHAYLSACAAAKPCDFELGCGHNLLKQTELEASSLWSGLRPRVPHLPIRSTPRVLFIRPPSPLPAPL